MSERRESSRHAHRLTRSGVMRMVSVVLTLVVTAAVFFFSAGSSNVASGWIYYGGLAGYLVVAMAVIFVFFPEAVETVNARGKINKDVKAWDKIFGVACTALVLGQPAAAGFELRSRGVVELEPPVAIVTLCITVLAYAFVHWAMVVNTHAETGVRIQHDRHHEVVSTGPYRVVRHPFYISMIVAHLVYPLAFGSLWALAVGVAIAVLFVWRTAKEDATLRRELEGYETFAKRTPYRLVPGVW